MKILQRIHAVMAKEFRQLMRDRLSLGMIIGIPVMQLLLFGHAINFDVRNVSAAVADLANTSLSRQVTQDLSQSQVIRMIAQAGSAEELEAMLRRGDISVGVFLPPDFDRRLQQADRSALQLLIDGSDPIVQGAVAQLAQPGRLSPYNDRPPLMELRTFYNPERRSAVNVVPGLIGVILTLTMILFTAVAIVRERERGNLELLITTPIKTPELMIAKMLPYVMIGLVQISLVLLLGNLVFNVPIRGQLLDFYLAGLAFIVANLALGLLISTLARTQFQAMQMMLFILLPSILLSGFVFPFDGMPDIAQWIAEALPMTHFIRLVRGVLLRGAGLSEMIREFSLLLGFAVLAMTFAVLRFRKRLD